MRIVVPLWHVSLQRSEKFIATNAHGMIWLRQERNAPAERMPRLAKAIALLRS